MKLWIKVVVVLVIICHPSMGDDGTTRIPVPIPWFPWTPVIAINDSMLANFTDNNTIESTFLHKDDIGKYDFLGGTRDYVAGFLKPIATLVIMFGGIYYATSRSDASKANAIRLFKDSIGAIVMVMVITWIIYDLFV